MKIREELNQTIFLSYSHDNFDIVKKIAQKISEQYDIWVDFSEIHAKEIFNDEIAQGIENCDLFVSIISDSYIKKQFCLEELTFAQNKKKERMPLFIEKINLPSELSFIFGTRESQLRTTKGYEETEDEDNFVNEICNSFLENVEKFFIVEKIRKTGQKIELKNLNIDFATISYNYENISRNGYFEKKIYTELYPSFNVIEKHTEDDECADKKKRNKSEYKALKDYSDNNKRLIGYIENNKKKHIVLYGEGGSGKTVAVKKIYSHFSENGIPALYVPLNKIRFGDENGNIEKYIEDIVAGPINWSIIRKLATTDIYDKRVVLILDGYNEITENIIKATNQISEIMSWKNIQVIITSRYNCSDTFSIHNLDRIETLQVMPLDKEKVVEHLISKGIDYSLISDKLINLISNPLMLILYSESDIVDIYSFIQNAKETFYYYPLGIAEKPDTQGKIIYNYLISQLYKKTTEKAASMLDCFFAVEFALPLLAFFIINSDDGFRIKKDDFFEYLTAALNNNDISNKYISRRFVNIQTGLRISDESFAQNCNVRTINCILNELSLVNEKDGQLEFAHQTFRDFFAALFLSKQIERLIPKSEVAGFMKAFFSSAADKAEESPFAKEVLAAHIYSSDVLSFCATILEEEKAKPLKNKNDIFYPGKEKKLSASEFSYAERVLSLYRNEEGTKAQNSVANLISIMKIARGYNLSNCDFSGLDLRSSDLARIHFTDWINDNIYPSSFENSIIDMKSFIKSGHYSQIMKLFLDSEKRIYSIDSEGIINVWSPGCSESIRSYSVKIDDDVIDLSVNSDGSIIAILTHQVVYLYNTSKNLTEIKTTTHYFKQVRFNDKNEPEVTYDIKPMVWKGIDEKYEFDDTPDFPARASAVSPDKMQVVKSGRTIDNETILKKYSNDGEEMNKTFSKISSENAYSLIKSIKFSPDGSILACCADNFLILLDTENMKELNRATLKANVNDVCFIDNDSIVAAVGESLLFFDSELNVSSTIKGYKAQSLKRGFYYKNSYWCICHNKTILKFDRDMNIDLKRQLPHRAWDTLTCGKDIATREFRLFFIENNQCYMYNFFTDEIEPAITNYIIDEDLEDSTELFPYRIYIMNGNILRCVDRNDQHNIKIYKNFGAFNIYKCNFHNVKGDILNNLKLIQQEGGQIDERI